MLRVSPSGWAAYFSDNSLFLQKAPVIRGAMYPDFGCNFELFTNPDFLEVGTLGPKVRLHPGEHAPHTEIWGLFRDVPAGEDENWIRSAVLPLVTTYLDPRSEFHNSERPYATPIS
jgi:hypothetical protein